MADLMSGSHTPNFKHAARSTPARTPHANLTNETGNLRRVLRIWRTRTLRSGRRVEYMRFGKDGLRPLIWLHSIEFPSAPPWGMCVDAAETGFGVVAIRRPGFGATSKVTTVEDEAGLLAEFIDAEGYENAVLIMEGSARPAGVRLAMSSKRIAFSILAKPGYNNQPIENNEPDWIANILRQTVLSQPGANLALASLRSLGPGWLFGPFFGVEGDQEFLKTHRRDVADAWQCLCGMDAETFRRNIAFAQPDPLLTAGALKEFPGIAVIGEDSPALWRTGFDARSGELGIRTVILPRGCIFVLQQSRKELLELLRDI